MLQRSDRPHTVPQRPRELDPTHITDVHKLRELYMNRFIDEPVPRGGLSPEERKAYDARQEQRRSNTLPYLGENSSGSSRGNKVAEENVPADSNDGGGGGARYRLSTVAVVGHAHIDLAWLVCDAASLALVTVCVRLTSLDVSGPSRKHATRLVSCCLEVSALREVFLHVLTPRPSVRTVGTQVNLLRDYPHHTFFQSNAWVYEQLKNDAPDLFESVQNLVRRGRWEAEGALYVECDTNLPSGESLVRQLLYGKHVFQSLLNHNSTIVWLPDSFGE